MSYAYAFDSFDLNLPFSMKSVSLKGDDTALVVEGLLQFFCVWLSASGLQRHDWDWMSH